MLQSHLPLGSRPTWLTRHLAERYFCLYLTHETAVHCAQKWLINDALQLTGSAMFFCCAATSVLAALALRFAVERPFL